MSFKIGFTVEKEHKENTIITAPVHDVQPRKSVVDVYFEDREITCTYYNDKFDLKCGDIVYVEGKLEGVCGRIVNVNYSFKIKLSDYKRVISVADTEVAGKFSIAGTHLITTQCTALPYEQAQSWYMPKSIDDDVVYSSSDETFSLSDLGALKIDEKIAHRGHQYYMENRVVYIEIKNTKARAIVVGSKPYEVEFDYKDGNISNLVCNCYCTANCKHEFACLLQLKETLEIINKDYGDKADSDYLAIISKAVFFRYVIDNNIRGNFTLG